MQENQSLFILQTELVDKKVEVAVQNNIATVNSAILNLRDEIVSLRHEMVKELHEVRQEMRQEMHDMRYEFGTRLTALETAFSLQEVKQAELRNRILDFTFKAGWVAVIAILSAAFSSLASSLHNFMK